MKEMALLERYWRRIRFSQGLWSSSLYKRSRPSPACPRRLVALSLPAPSGGELLKRLRCGGRCSWICPATVTLADRRCAVGWESTPRCLLRSFGSSAGWLVRLGLLPRPPGPQGAGRAWLAPGWQEPEVGAMLAGIPGESAAGPVCECGQSPRRGVRLLRLVPAQVC